MSAKQTAIGAAGAGLLIVNFWTGASRTAVSGGLASGASPAQTQAAHGVLVKYAAALLFLGGMTLVAGVSDTAASAMIAIIGALWLLWAITHFTGQQATPAQKH